MHNDRVSALGGYLDSTLGTLASSRRTKSSFLTFSVDNMPIAMKDLFIQGIRRWNKRLIEQMFDLESAKQILKIRPLHISLRSTIFVRAQIR